MDERRFDAIARFLDVIQTRRGTLRDALAGVLALAIAGPNLAEARNKKKKRKKRRRRRRNRCPGGQTRCFGTCTDTNSDPRNCGFCGKDCDDDEVCSNGQCVESGCSGGLTRCNGVCVNTNTDPLNCGGCGNVCEDEETCRNGTCAESCDVCERGCPFETVQAAIDAADPGSEITICPGRYTGNIVIDKDITLTGEENVVLRSEGDSTDNSVLTVLAGVTAIVRDALITGGTGTPDEGFVRGGGVFNRGTLTLIRVRVANNEAEEGGGIVNHGGAELTLDDSDVVSNKAVSDDPRPTFGGGILNLFGGEMTIINGSVIGDNRSLNSAGIHNNGTMEVRDSDVSGNIAEFDGGGIINDQAALTLSNTRVRNNEANDGRGGGILNLSFELEIENGSEISHNKASGDGGGIYNEPPGDLIITDSAILNNEADGDGGGIFNNAGEVTLVRSTVRENESGGSGGGVFNSGELRAATLVLANTAIIENDAQDDGGGIFNTEDSVVVVDALSIVEENEPNNCVGTNACDA